MARLISHRGNLDGPSGKENTPFQIDYVTGIGVECEIDVWYVDDKLYLGHDRPIYQVTHRWLSDRANLLWIHLKNVPAFHRFRTFSDEFHYFWHETDALAITSKRYGWTCRPDLAGLNVVYMCADASWQMLPSNSQRIICSDYIE